MAIRRNMLGFRIFNKKYHEPFFAPGIEGRWNSAGKKVLYCNDSIPLAFLESMIRRQGVGFNHDFQIAHIDIPGYLQIQQQLNLKDLEPGWDNPHDYSKSKPLGDRWYNEQVSPVLIVPSATLPVCNNYVINTLHPDFTKIKLIALTPLMPDARIDEILRKAK